MKNFIKIICFIFIIIYTLFTIYIYFTNSSLSSTVQDNDALRTKIESIDEFKTNTLNMAIMSKYYLITGDDYYKTQFENNYNTSYKQITKLSESGYINESEKENLKSNLDKYLNIVQTESFYENPKDINSNLKSQLQNLANIETNIINDTSNVLYSSLKTTKNNNEYAINLVSNQNDILEVIGGFLSMLFIYPLYFVSKNHTVFNGLIKTFFSEYFSKKIKSPSTKNEENPCDEKMLQCINESIIRNFQEKINDRNLLVSTLKIIYSHSEYMEKEWEEGKNILDSVEMDLSNLRSDLDSLLNKSEIPYERFNIIENKLLEVKFLLEKLPGYHDFIMKLTEPYKSNI